MSGTIDQELSPTAAQRILRSIALLDWTKPDQATGVARGQSIFVDVPALQELADDILMGVVFDDVQDAEVFDDIQQSEVFDDHQENFDDHQENEVLDDVQENEVFDDVQEVEEPTAFSASHWWKHAGGYWYLNEVPEEFMDFSEKELWTPDSPINLREDSGVGGAEPDEGGVIEATFSALQV
jgi:hypothetical protein